MWGNWSSCSGTCGIATKTRTRTCSQPAPKNGGAQCPGNHTQMHACFDRSCPGIIIVPAFKKSVNNNKSYHIICFFSEKNYASYIC